MNYGFLRVCCVSPEIKVADTVFNSEKIIDSVRSASQEGAEVIVTPELSITGYTCQDLFLQRTLQENAVKALELIAKKTSSIHAVILLGLPLCVESALYNVAAVLFRGKILAFIPKTFIPNYSEFYEKRWFKTGTGNLPETVFVSKAFPEVPFGKNILICDKENPAFTLGVEICEDLWVPSSPSVQLALRGASVIANLSASNEIIGKADYRRNLVKLQSAKLVCAYLYADASHDESTQDLVFSGHNMISEYGTLLKEALPFAEKNMIISDVDLERLLQERRRTTTFNQCAEENAEKTVEESGKVRKIYIELKNEESPKKKLLRFTDPHPFVPSDSSERSERSRLVVQLQAEGLAKRLRHINCHSAVIGLSGGLDSTLALLVTAKAFDMCGLNRNEIRAVTMPCFGTTDRTYTNACILAKETGSQLLEVKISDSVRLHMKDIGQDESIHDVTYENCQARERTQVLMDIANKTNGIVIGTGDLSELALGWCTYNGDHMSMYGVNSSIPKTLVRHLVKYFSDEASKKEDGKKLSDVLLDILDTPVSPELLPPSEGKISQKTEDLVGPYELHDFFLYYLLRFGFAPSKILYLADSSSLPYEHEFKLKWLRTFYRRFFTQQFKRSCMPDGAKVGTVNLSPRGDWRMPSDASAQIWLNEIDRIR